MPVCSKTLKVLDHPAADIEAAPFQFIDNSHRIGFDAKYQAYQKSTFPASISAADINLRNEYLHANNLLLIEEVENR